MAEIHSAAMTMPDTLLWLTLGGLLALGCVTGSSRSKPTPEPEAPAVLGATTRAEIESAMPDWIEATVLSEPDGDSVMGLLDVEAAEVAVYLGTWCSDSRRELARFWKALDTLPYEPPFEVRYVAVDRDNRDPEGLVEGLGLELVPTFVVRREGVELGRIIEVSPQGVEIDLLDLLTGRASGWISARDDLAQGPGGR